ncbi:MAG: restriction endonuclease subunit R [Prevotella sp.]|jgi:hypothetical protein|nr:restriction endonuclease subunit R [Prevotella sp.]MCH3992843.1 restriction endonuclease subunit R [Prevotella sp.]MCH4099422.1 restriction endonuclease subunit R [Prevotella sp.]MCI1472779.1 restriction endonuclease subunit R [Prevotella sp.]MCI1517964.1 restriction endonuclease subunit R [Prevotella sp.]MCI1548540.1 restriction endonuclease subunit R [Prevotella sp.]
MNKTLWNYYKNSDDGKHAVEMFDPETNDIDGHVWQIASFFKRWDPYLTPDNVQFVVYVYCINFLHQKWLPIKKVDRRSFENFVEQYEIRFFDFSESHISRNLMVPEDVNFDNSPRSLLIPSDKYRAKAASAHFLSLLLYYFDPFFKPMMLVERFDIFQRSCDMLGIDLPPIPRTKAYKDYLLYYYDLCENLKDFQNEYGLSDAEVCACIYDYGGRVLLEESENKVPQELPQPVNVWLTGASGSGDFALLDAIKNSPVQRKSMVWAGNEHTRTGDIVVMYCTSPRCYIHSIWRAGSGSVFNPFDYYHDRIQICDGHAIPEITYKELKADPYFSKVPIVRKNLQGVKGVELKAEDYDRLLKLIQQKGGDISCLPHLFSGTAFDFGKIVHEKDVEEQILIPFLKMIGYQESDWVRQLMLKAGRQEKAIPDFVFFPVGERHFESAPMVIEVKLDFSSHLELQKAFRQCLSYARMLRSRLMGICDKERLLIYKVNMSGMADITSPIFENHWPVIFSNDLVGAHLNQLIGAEVIKTK